MSSIGELFGFPGEQNDTPFDPSTLDAQIDQILATRPPAGAPEGYAAPARPPAPSMDGDQGATGGGQGPAASVAPETPTVPPPFEWPQGPTSAVPPVADPAQPPAAPPADPFSGLSELERYEALQVVQALRDPERAAGIRRAYIGGTEPMAPPAQPPAVAAPQLPTPPQLPPEIEEGTVEAAMWFRQAETERQLADIRAQVTQQNQQNEHQLELAAAQSAVQAFQARYGDRLSAEEIGWVCQTAGFQKLPEAFRSSNPNLSREQAMNQALEFQLRSTDSLFAKIVGGAPPAALPPVPPAAPPAPPVFPGQTPQADARHRYLTALSSAASPSGDVPQRLPLAHRADGKLDEKSRMQLVQDMTSGGAMGELMGPG